MLHTTFRLAKEAGACETSYRKFANYVGGIRKFGQDTPIPLTDILDVLGVLDAAWCLRRTTIEPQSKSGDFIANEMFRYISISELTDQEMTDKFRKLLIEHIEH